MSAESRCVVGLDLGTTKISTVISEITPNKMPRILGFASCASQGLRRGVITDVEKTVQSVEKAVRQAELMAGTEVKEVFVGIAGEHVTSQDSSGVVAVAGSDGGRSVDPAVTHQPGPRADADRSGDHAPWPDLDVVRELDLVVHDG